MLFNVVLNLIRHKFVIKSIIFDSHSMHLFNDLITWLIEIQNGRQQGAFDINKSNGETS